jgi:3-hydroxyacyl-CoA dehydrogenase
MINIKTVTVVGANGTMGCNVSGIFASFGEAKVFMVSRDIEKSRRAMTRAAQSVRAESILSNLIPCDYSQLTECISQSDLIFESVSEDIKVKKEIIRRIGTCLPSHAIVCSGSSGLSLTAIAGELPKQLRSHYFGVHMFNPPYSLPLCEFTCTPYSSQELGREIKKYLIDILYRSVISVKDSPAFLGNRIGFQFINQALRMAEQYKDCGGIDYIDAVLGSFSGRNMPPLLTADFVGLDVHSAIIDNLYANTNDYAHQTFAAPSFVRQMIDAGHLGRKTKSGLYKTEILQEGLKKHTVWDISTRRYREIMRYSFPFATQMNEFINVGDYKQAISILIHNHSTEAELCLKLILEYIVYSLITVREVAFTVHAADTAMAEGFNWCPPLAWIDIISQLTNFQKLVQERIDPTICQHIDINQLCQDIEPSIYNYRKFLRATR